MGWGGGPTHYVVTPTQVEVELRLSWANDNNRTALGLADSWSGAGVCSELGNTSVRPRVK